MSPGDIASDILPNLYPKSVLFYACTGSDAIGSPVQPLWLRLAIDAGIVCLATQWWNIIQTYTDVTRRSAQFVSVPMYGLLTMVLGAPFNCYG